MSVPSRSPWFRLPLMAALAGCTPEKDATGEDTGPAETGTTDTGTDTDTVPDTGTPPGGPGVAGILVDPQGAPLAFTEVLCCMITTCFFADTEADGSFAFDLEPGTEVALKTHGDPYVQPRWAAALEPAVAGDELIDVGELYVPDLPAGMPVGPESEDPQTLQVGDGLELTLNGADLVPDLGVFLYDIAARRIPDPWVPTYPGLQGTVHAVYALHPFATTSSSPVGIAIPTDLPDGTEVRFQSVSHIDGTLSAPAVGRVQGGRASTDPGKGITLLTHLVISVP